MKRTLIVETEGLAGHENMRRDYLLLQAAQEGVFFFRLYRWDPGCLSFGRNEPALRRYDRALIESLDLQTVRRPTGGRAVWHHHEVTYSVAGPVSKFGSLADTYILFHEMLARAMTRLGIDARLAEKHGRTPGLESGPCFASPVGGEVVVGDRKLIGSAQIREGNAFLQHGSILLEDGQDVVSGVSKTAAMRAQSTSINAMTETELSFEVVMKAIADEVRNTWPDDWAEEVVPEYGSGMKLDFTDSQWTWRR